jgi:hypothetical protein
MIVMIVDQQILSPKQVCQNCLMSDQSGLPRWRDSKLGCGKLAPQKISRQAPVYQCQMGFNVAWVS